MAFAQRRVTSSGAVRWYATYFTPDGRQMVGGGYAAKRDAERAADRFEKDAEGGVVVDSGRRKISFAATSKSTTGRRRSTSNRRRAPRTGRTSTSISSLASAGRGWRALPPRRFRPG
jgi:hypothetical protein